MSIPVSVIVMTKNESSNISKCLATLREFDEVFVVDSDSADSTRSIAERLGAKVIRFVWNGQYPKKKQWCLEHVPMRNDWVLYVDADEEIPATLALEIDAAVRSGRPETGYYVIYDYWFGGRLLRHGHRVEKLILFRRESGRFIDYDDLEVTNMWEVEGHYQPLVQGRVRRLKCAAVHRDHKDMFQYFVKLNRYTDWEAYLRTKGVVRRREGASSRLRLMLQYLGDRVPFRPTAIFLYSYIVKRGFLDGATGLQFARALAIYYGMIEIKRHDMTIRDKR